MKTNKTPKTVPGGNLVTDKILQGMALFTILALAYTKVLDFVPTTGTNMRYVLAALPVAVIIYMILAPLFRK